MKDIEIEIQVRISEDERLKAFLAEKARFASENYQKDQYFTPAHRNFIEPKPVKEWLRLRESGENSITYKNWHYTAEGKGTHCDEYESSIGDIEQLQKIFQALNIKPVITVEKTRKTWLYENYEIALDHVTGLGDFVEIEYKSQDTSVNPEKVTGEMIAFLKNIGCGKIEANNVGYPFMLLYPNEVTFEEM